MLDGDGKKNKKKNKKKKQKKHKNHIALFSSFSLSYHRSRKKWIIDTMCGIASLFFEELSLLISLIHSRKHLSPYNPATKKEKEPKSQNLSS